MSTGLDAAPEFGPRNNHQAGPPGLDFHRREYA